MAEIQESGGRRSRPKNLELNLVPFIDLMSVLITFLLITAVWTQVSMVQIGTSLYGKKQDSDPPPIAPEDAIAIRLDIHAKGYNLIVGRNSYQFPLINTTEYDSKRLIQQLEVVKQEHPAKKDAAIQMSDELPYEQLIAGMDAMLKSGFEQLSVLTGGPK